MPVYDPLVPTGLVNLDVDYKALQNNFNQANIVYGKDHYAFDNATTNEGFHNTVTTPPVVNNPADGLPPATVANPKFYAFEQYNAMGVLQYSRGPNSAVPTTLTKKHSTATPISLASNAAANVMNFTGISFGMCNLYAINADATVKSCSAYVVWNGSAFQITPLTNIIGLNATSTTTTLQVQNTSGTPLNNVYWTLDILRIQ